jgi:hypothetical protein
MKGRKGRSGLKGQLVEKSVDAYVLALETINRLSIKYRVESFTHLICNAWELLLKARVLDVQTSRDAIYYRTKRGDPKRTISLRDALIKVVPNEKEALRRNLEVVADLRDEAMHFVISEVPNDVLLLFQACVINYHKKLNEWFGISLSDRVTVGMMTIVYDLSPGSFDLGSPAVKRRLGKDVAAYLAQMQKKIQAEFTTLQRSPEFSIGVEYKLVLTKKPGDADIVLSTGEKGASATVVQVAKDPSVSHPHRQKELLAALTAALAGAVTANQHDVQCVNKVHGVKKRPDWFYQGKVVGSPSQYSQAFVDWMVERVKQDPLFFVNAREGAKKSPKK